MLPELEKEIFPYAIGTEPSTINKTGECRALTPDKRSSLSPCRAGCLLDGEIPQWLEAVKRQRWDEAWQIISRYNPFPALTGSVCYQPCSVECNRGQLDQAIDIRTVELALGRWRHDSYRGRPDLRTVAGRIAVAGSGPAGLSCAYYLNSNGYEVTVFEKEQVIGGMLALGIPSFRLPRNILQAELAILKDIGIKFISGCEIGRDIPLNVLYADFDHVFLATGAWVPRKAAIPGEERAGVLNALDFLSAVNTGKNLKITGPVVVIGGGNAAVDSARVALRLPGVDNVSLVYRRSRAEMPAEQGEVEAAEKEGVELIFNAMPARIEEEQGAVSRLLFRHSKTGRDKLIIDSSSSYEKTCGAVIMALGQDRDYGIFSGLPGERPLFAGGDLVSGPATVPEAIRAGRLAALGIMAAVEGLPGPDLAPVTASPVKFEELNLAAEVNLQLGQKQEDPAVEAARCLGCGSCNSCGICYQFCPDMAVERVDGCYEFNLDYCKGCGICEKECPARALVMEGGG